MVATTAPDTLAIGNAIVSYLSNLTYPGTSTIVYTLSQLEAIKDISDMINNNQVCVEVYGSEDHSERRGFGGRIWDTQTWFVLSMCSLDSPSSAETIYNVRDALVLPFQAHVQLGDQVYNLFQAQLKPTMKFLRINRNGIWVRAHLAELEVKQEWFIPGGIVS